jgi:DNA-binding MarR family transcriptional regulator
MDTQDIRILKILEKVHGENPSSQRALARELNISLGLVNSFIKRLALKGYVKATTIPRKRIKYILTPKGITEKTRLTYNYLQYSYQFYRSSRQKFRRLFADMESQGVRRIVFFGASDLAEIAFLSLQDTLIDLVAVVDDRRLGKKVLGREVIDSRRLANFSFDRIVVTDDAHRDLILDTLKSSRIPRSEVVFVE